MPVKDGSHAPEERVNLTYKTDTGDESAQKELPLKLLVVGDFTDKPGDEAIKDRKLYSISQPTDFDKVLKASDVSLNLRVDDLRNSEKPTGEKMDVSLKFDSLKDFDPDEIVKKVPALKQLLELREALMELKGPLANEGEFRKRVQAILNEKGSGILDHLGLSPTEK